MAEDAKIPDDARCLGCGHRLIKLPMQTCPECGRWYDPHDATTFGNGSSLTRWRLVGRVLVSPTLIFVVLVWLAISFMVLVGFTAELSLAFPLLILAILGWSSWSRLRRVYRKRTRVPPGHCQNCGYCLTGNITGVCPECGSTCSSDLDDNRSQARTLPRVILPASMLIGIVVWASYAGLLNAGLHSGYYGQLNRVKARLKAIPNLTIRGIRCNYDTSLEDFTFDVTVNGQYDASLYFHEPPSPSWQLFDAADGLLIRCRKQESSASWESAHHWWWFGLGPDAVLEGELGCEMRNLHDVFTHFGDIMELIEATPVDILDEQRPRPDSWRSLTHLTISIPYPAARPE